MMLAYMFNMLLPIYHIIHVSSVFESRDKRKYKYVLMKNIIER